MPPVLRSPGPLTGDRRDRFGFVLGLGLLLAAIALNLLLPDRVFPLTATLVAPLAASALSRPRQVASVGALSVGAAFLLAFEEGLLGELSGVTRVSLVLITTASSVLVAQVRTSHERQLERAHRSADTSLTLQRRLIPDLGPTDRVDVRVTYRPSGVDLVLGGDFIDVIPFPAAGPGAVAFCVGDVTGHDASAAGMAASLRAAWRVLALSGGEPAGWLAALDAFVRTEAVGDELATACAGVLDPSGRCLAVASAGHPRPIVLGEQARLVELEPGPPLGMPVGLGGGWETEMVGLDEQFALVLYTDGLVEGRSAPGSPQRFGEESLTAWLDAAHPVRALSNERIARLLLHVEQANGGPLMDDVALVVLASRVGGDASQAAPGVQVSRL